ncbi:MAG: hypothetical protein QME42_10395 [bacterium]|nr:hypothetical protein [bacterium]
MSTQQLLSKIPFNGMIKLDRTIWRKAIIQYQSWNESKLVEQIRSAGQKTPAEKWEEYKQLISLCWRLKPEPSLKEDYYTMNEWAAYYASIQRFEEKRKEHGKGHHILTP